MIFRARSGNFHHFHLKELFDDVDQFIEEPDVRSPSPVTGILQYVGHKLSKWRGIYRKKERSE